MVCHKVTHLLNFVHSLPISLFICICSRAKATYPCWTNKVILILIPAPADGYIGAAGGPYGGFEVPALRRQHY